MTRLTGSELACMTRQEDSLLPLVLPPTTESQIAAGKGYSWVRRHRYNRSCLPTAMHLPIARLHLSRVLLPLKDRDTH